MTMTGFPPVRRAGFLMQKKSGFGTSMFLFDQYALKVIEKAILKWECYCRG